MAQCDNATATCFVMHFRYKASPHTNKVVINPIK